MHSKCLFSFDVGQNQSSTRPTLPRSYSVDSFFSNVKKKKKKTVFHVKKEDLRKRKKKVASIY